jgi:hypothetical protein
VEMGEGIGKGMRGVESRGRKTHIRSGGSERQTVSWDDSICL